MIAVSEVGSLAGMNPNTNAYSALLDALIEQVHKNGGTFTVLSASLPYDAARYTEADAFVITWNARGMSEDPRVTEGPVNQFGASMPAALYLMLSPDAAFTGKLPVNIPAMDAEYQYTDDVLYPRGFGLTGQVAVPGDVKETDWFYGAVVYVTRRNIIASHADGSFDPYAKVTRGDAAGYLRTLAGGSGAADSLLTGNMEEIITREAFIAALYAFAKDRGKDVSVGEDTNILSYDDAFDVSEYAIPAIQWACGAGIINGTSASTLSPKAEVTRAQAAVMLLRYGGAAC